MLQSSKVIETGKEYRVHILRFVWSRNNSCYEDLCLLVMCVRSMIKYDPDDNPTIQCFVHIELGTIKRQQENNIVLLNTSCSDSFNIFSTIQEVMESLLLPMVLLKFPHDFFHPPALI